MKKTLILFIIPLLSFSQINYETEIQPIFNAECVGCHQGDAAYFGGLNLTTYDNLMDGGYTQGGVITTGLLENYITTGYMPAYGSGNSLSETEVNLIVQWISEGASNNNVHTLELINHSQKEVSSFNIFGQESNKFGLQIHIYNDGSVEKKYVIK